MFAVQYWTECFTAVDAEETYKKLGESDLCVDGMGGPLALSVYRTNPCGKNRLEIVKYILNVIYEFPRITMNLIWLGWRMYHKNIFF